MDRDVELILGVSAGEGEREIGTVSGVLAIDPSSSALSSSAL